MPQLAQLAIATVGAIGLGACGFDADYGGGRYTCSDGVCPSGLSCVAQVCIAGDAMPMIDDGPPPPDEPPPALTCADPGDATGTHTGTTVGRANTASASCNALVMNGPDAVYAIAATAGQQLTLTIDGAGTYPARAYAYTPCMAAPATPPCTGNMFATEVTPAQIAIPTTGTYYVVVDGENAALSGGYTLTVLLAAANSASDPTTQPR